jgi:hypothetical protein
VDVTWLLRAARRARVRYWLRPVWRSLVALGSSYAAPMQYPASASAPFEPSGDPYAGDPRGGRRLPGPAHPERVPENQPLSQEELRIAQDLWPRRYGRPG